MECKHFGSCGSCSLYELDYTKQIENKVSLVKDKFKLEIPLKICDSKTSHFRNRAEFRIYHYEDENISYAMHTYDKKILPIDTCSIVGKSIYTLMPLLLSSISKNQTLKHKLFSIEFLGTEEEDSVLVTMIYHKKLEDIWQEEAKILQESLGIFIVGRSRKQKLILKQDFIQEKLNISNKKYTLNYYEASFTQPNTLVNEKMIEFGVEHTKNIKGDLLELYCGCGNFTMAISKNFDKVLATEISKKSIYASKENAQINNIANISFTRLSTQELIQAIKKEREFNRLRDIDLDSFNFKAVLIDPPRSGLDEITRNFIKQFDTIIYISCNIDTLKNDIDILKHSHKIKKWAMFDQFAYTSHIEMGMVLERDTSGEN